MKSLNLNYGVEIELASSRKYDDYDIKEWLREAGIHDWKIVEDSSCGWEVVSPILNGYNGYSQIERVCKILKKNGAYTNVKCGLHVHIGVENLSVDEIRNVVLRYKSNSHHIDSFLPLSRYNNEFSKPLGITINRKILEQALTLEQLQMAQYQRYSHINLYPLRCYGTMEFRQHSGTINPNRIINWIDFLKYFIESTVFFKSTYDTSFDDLFGYKIHLRDYYKKRAAFLEKYYDTHTVYNY